MTLAAALLAAVALSQQQITPRDARPTSAAEGGRIAGVVTTDDAHPRPLRRARVTLTGLVDGGFSIITGDDGAFAFDGLPPGRYVVGALKDGYVSRTDDGGRSPNQGRAVHVNGGETIQLTLQLQRGAVITGTVIDVDGQPASGALVSALARRYTGGITGDDGYRQSGTPRLAETDDSGVYRIYGLPPGEYVISARPTISPATGVMGPQVQLMARGVLMEKRWVLAQVYSPGVMELARAARVRVSSGEERAGVDVQLEYVPLATIAGLALSPPGFAPARLTLSHTDEQTLPQSATAVTADTDGHFRFPSVAPGNYRIAAHSMSLSSTSSRYATADVVVNGDDVDVGLTLQPTLSISGELVFESAQARPPRVPEALRTGLPLLVTPATGGWLTPPLVIDGAHFRLDDVTPGQYRLNPTMQGIRYPIGSWWLTSLTAGGRELLDAPVEIQRSYADAVATLSDHPSALTGTVTDATGTGTPDPWVLVFPEQRAFWFSGSRRIVAVKPNQQGRFAIRNLPPGEYRVTATMDLQQGEWSDPNVLQSLQTSAVRLTIAGAEAKTVDLVIR